ncbi:hypothetical protein KPA97_67435, partial [Burkholderia cenocepacia]|nr:hypothetical protein [Burkholderia cenocepacia]
PRVGARWLPADGIGPAHPPHHPGLTQWEETMLNLLTSLDHLLTVLLPFVAVALFVLFTVLNVVKQRRERERREAAMLAAQAQARSNPAQNEARGFMGIQARINVPL